MVDRDRRLDTLNPASGKAWEMARAVHEKDPNVSIYKKGVRPFTQIAGFIMQAEAGSYQNGDAYLPTSTGVIRTTHELSFYAKAADTSGAGRELWKVVIGEDGGVRVLEESIMDSAIPTSDDIVEVTNPLGETDTTTTKSFDAAFGEAFEVEDAELSFETETNFNLLTEAETRTVLRLMPPTLRTDDMKQRIDELGEDVDDREPVMPATRQLLEDVIDELANQIEERRSLIELKGTKYAVNTKINNGKLSEVELVTRTKKIDDPELETVRTWVFPGDSSPVTYVEEELLDLSSVTDHARAMMMLAYNNRIRKATAELSDDQKRANPDRIKEGLEALEMVSKNGFNT